MSLCNDVPRDEATTPRARSRSRSRSRCGSRSRSRSRSATPPSAGLDTTLFHEATRLLDGMARGMARQIGDRFHVGELKSFAHEVLMEIVARFDAARGADFSTYARVRLRGAIIDGMRKEAGVPRGVASRLRAAANADLFVDANADGHAAREATSARTRAADAKLESFLRGVATASSTGLLCGGRDRDGEEHADLAASREDPELHVQRAELRRVIERALGSIGDKEAAIVRRHYFDDQDLQDAAAELGLSKSWGSRLHARGIDRLGAKLREMNFEHG